MAFAVQVAPEHTKTDGHGDGRQFQVLPEGGVDDPPVLRDPVPAHERIGGTEHPIDATGPIDTGRGRFPGGPGSVTEA